MMSLKRETIKGSHPLKMGRGGGYRGAQRVSDPRFSHIVASLSVNDDRSLNDKSHTS